MAKRMKSHDQQTVHEDARVKELLVEVQAIEERRQCALVSQNEEVSQVESGDA